MAVSTKRKNVSNSKSKSFSKSNKGSSSRKQLNKYRKSGTKTRKMRGGGEKTIDGQQKPKKPRKTMKGTVMGWFGKKPVEPLNLGKISGFQSPNLYAPHKKQPMSQNEMFKRTEERKQIAEILRADTEKRNMPKLTNIELESKAEKLLAKGYSPKTYAEYVQEYYDFYQL